MSKIKVLLVDDEVRLSQALKLALEQHGPYEVRVENDARKARQAAEIFRPDVLVLDIIMPEKDGGEVAAEIRSDPTMSHLPVIFLTSIIGKEEAASRGGLLGYDLVLAKPVTLGELTTCIDKCLKAHGHPKP